MISDSLNFCLKIVLTVYNVRAQRAISRMKLRGFGFFRADEGRAILRVL